MNKLIDYIEKTQQNIFKYNIEQVTKNIGSVCDEIENMILNLDEKGKNQLNEIIYFINISLQNNDYFLCADILEYELIPFLKTQSILGGI